MGTLVARRLAAMIPVLVLVTFGVFAIIHLTPGDPIDAMMGESFDPAAKERLRIELGLDQPIYVQYLSWVTRVVQGDFGRSIRDHQLVIENVSLRIGVTAQLALFAMVISLAVAFPIGIMSATHRNSPIDGFGTMFALFGICMPNFLLALLLIYWQLLLQAGRRLHVTHRKNFELQYRNMQLIDSLTRQTQAALDAVEIKNRFLASAAHDLRQPVHALGLYADWLGSEPELASDIAPKIVESTKAVNALFDSLFDLVRLDSGKIRLNIEPVHLDKLLHDLELQYRPLAKAKGLQFRMHVVPGTVMSDPILLQRIVGNLISNAVKYTARGGILVASRVTPSGRRIEIWDTGMGIAPEHQREIFREFYKVPAHAGTEDGFGLGLYIVARLSNILGHPLGLLSRPGRGTLFRLILNPTDPQQAAERAAAAQLVSRP